MAPTSSVVRCSRRSASACDALRAQRGRARHHLARSPRRRRARDPAAVAMLRSAPNAHRGRPAQEEIQPAASASDGPSRGRAGRADHPARAPFDLEPSARPVRRPEVMMACRAGRRRVTVVDNAEGVGKSRHASSRAINASRATSARRKCRAISSRHAHAVPRAGFASSEPRASTESAGMLDEAVGITRTRRGVTRRSVGRGSPSSDAASRVHGHGARRPTSASADELSGARSGRPCELADAVRRRAPRLAATRRRVVSARSRRRHDRRVARPRRRQHERLARSTPRPEKDASDGLRARVGGPRAGDPMKAIAPRGDRRRNQPPRDGARAGA